MKVEVEGTKFFDLNDDTHFQPEEGKPSYICKIVEIFEGVDGFPCFRAQWYYTSVDTVIKKGITLKEAKRVFASEVMDDNPLDCLLEKLNIFRVALNLDIDSKMLAIPECDYYFDIKYLMPYSSYIAPPPETLVLLEVNLRSTISNDIQADGAALDKRILFCQG